MTDWDRVQIHVIHDEITKRLREMSGISNSDFIRYGGFPMAPIGESMVKLKVTLSRPLTWSEREWLRVHFTNTFRVGSQKVFDEVIVLEVDVETSDDPTRGIAWELHDFLAKHFFNVHIRAVKTVSPVVKL